MKKLLCLATLYCALTGFAQQNPAEPTIRITVNLVQVDAVVTDSKGKLIGDLKASDFEILQDGKPQKIQSFSYVRTGPDALAAGAVKQPVKRAKNAPPPPPSKVDPRKIRRTVAIVVDDLSLSWESMAQAQQAMKKFIEQKVQPGDLVAIVRTGAGMGALQSFTTDKTQMLAAVARVKWNPLGRGRVSAFGGSDDEDEGAAAIDDFRDRIYSVGTLGAINYVVNGLKDLPGRKSVVVVSDGMRIFDASGNSDRVLDTMRRLTDLANRASVVIYTLDARGLPTLNIGAAERGPRSSNPMAMSEAMNRRKDEYFESQNGLNYLAAETGGIFFHDSNDLAGSLGKVLEDQSGYYLLGYSPSGETFNRKFHKIQVRLKKPGYKIRSRHGFLGIPDESRPAPRTRQQQIGIALMSPFGSSGVPLRLTTLFSDNLKLGSFVTSMLHIDIKPLKFMEDADGWKKAQVDITVLTFGDNGVPVDQTDKQFTLRLKAEMYDHAMKNGLVYTIHHPIKKPGAYQLRAAVRDVNTEVIGSASQFIDVPDLNKGRLAMSGLFLRTNSPKPQAAGQAEGQQSMEDPRANPAVRTFQHGQQMLYLFQVINAKQDPEKKADLDIQALLFRDGEKVFEGKHLPFGPKDPPDPKHLFAGGQLRLGNDLSPGDYQLQVLVMDKLGKPKQNLTAQWMDFVVEPAPPKQAVPQPAAAEKK
ncbi:MAG: VWA domain-containing protein [Candidatus Solibacter usitatus]|nr:VWA domain-containing protein [Candidatus Solibacter usitatus]